MLRTTDGACSAWGARSRTSRSWSTRCAFVSMEQRTPSLKVRIAEGDTLRFGAVTASREGISRRRVGPRVGRGGRRRGRGRRDRRPRARRPAPGEPRRSARCPTRSCSPSSRTGAAELSAHSSVPDAPRRKLRRPRRGRRSSTWTRSGRARTARSPSARQASRSRAFIPAIACGAPRAISSAYASA